MAEAVNQKPTKKFKWWQKLLIILVAIIVIIAIIFGVCYTIGAIGRKANLDYAKSVAVLAYDNEQIKPELQTYTIEGKDYKFWTFTTDRDFKVLQLTDIHIGAGFLSTQKDNWALKACESLIRQEKPDLVYVTGDIGWPVPYSSGTIDNIPPVEQFSTLMESLNVYWTFVFGNHDTEVYSLHDRKYISDWYLEHIKNGNLKYCLYTSYEDFSGVDENNTEYEEIEKGYGYGNQMIVVKNTAGKITQGLIGLDSGSYESGFLRNYDHIHQVQIDLYNSMIESLKIANGNVMPKTMVFFHIPIEEYKIAWLDLMDNNYKDTENTIYDFGSLGESGKMVYSGVTASGFFEDLISKESTQAVFCGHDHLNNFSVLYDGLVDKSREIFKDELEELEPLTIEGNPKKIKIRLTYSLSIDYIAYPLIATQTAQRGGTVITLKNDGNGSYEVYGRVLHDMSILGKTAIKSETK